MLGVHVMTVNSTLQHVCGSVRVRCCRIFVIALSSVCSNFEQLQSHPGTVWTTIYVLQSLRQRLATHIQFDGTSFTCRFWRGKWPGRAHWPLRWLTKMAGRRSFRCGVNLHRIWVVVSKTATLSEEDAHHPPSCKFVFSNPHLKKGLLFSLPFTCVFLFLIFFKNCSNWELQQRLNTFCSCMLSDCS